MGRSCNKSKWLSWLVGSVAVTIVIVLSFCRYSYTSSDLTPDHSKDESKNTSEATSNRSKRFLIFSGSGVVKLVLGASFPIMLADRRRSFGQFVNFQMQYSPPTIPVYWWSLYNTSTFAARKQRSADMLMEHDNSRSSVYEFMETIFERSIGNFNNECLLKVICEMARAPLSEDFTQRHRGDYGQDDDYGLNIYHKLINAIFTPHLPNVDQRYLNAQAAGSEGGDCDKLFARCPIVQEWLERFTRFI